jgi:hypothetical protein
MASLQLPSPLPISTRTLSLFVSGYDVGYPIAINISDRNRIRPEWSAVGPGGLEGAIAITQKYANTSAIGICNGQDPFARRY